MNRPLRVAMIIQSYLPRLGGAEQQVAAVAAEMVRQGTEVHVLTRSYPGMRGYEVLNGVPVHRLPAPGSKTTASLGYTLSALALLRHLRPDVIHAHELLSPTTTAVAARQMWRIPVAATVHLGGPQGELVRLQQKAFGKARLRLFKTQVDAFICISREIDTQLDQLGIPAARRKYIPNGVDTRRFVPAGLEQKAALRRAIQDTLQTSMDLTNSPIVVYSGRLVPRKRVDRLLAVWPSVVEAYPQVRLMIVGAGPEEAALREMAGRSVHFLGGVSDVAPFLQAADLFVLPSVAEGLSMALLEALACGLPSIAAEIGGNLDLISPGETGCLVPPDDTEALRRALLALLGDVEKRERIGRAARAFIQEHFSLAATVDRLIDLYRDLSGTRAYRQGERRPA